MHMAAFPYQHQVPYALDFAYLPSNFPADLPPPSAQQQAGDLVSVSPCVPCYYPQFDAMDDVFLPEISTLNTGASSSAITTTTTTCTPESSTSMETARRVPSVNGAPKAQCFPQKRKERQRCNFESEQSKDSKAGKGRKLRKRSGAPKKAQQEPPTGYVHVRARRGEATDSHSLAERVRRERIREKMQLLEDLVPGCHKVVGKALLLEEIINYVQSLQSQVEFLSMKLASMDPMLCDFGSHLDDYMIQPQRLESMSPEVLLNVQRTGHLQPTAFADATNSYPVHDSSVQFLLHEEGPFGCFPQDSGSNFIVQVRDQRQSFLNQIELNHMSFQ